MSKFTPGPWKVLEHSWSDTSIVAEGFDHGICLLDINHATEESQAADEAVMAANARLISAAPDLLEALREAWPYVPDHHGPVQARIKAALSKATGEPS